MRWPRPMVSKELMVRMPTSRGSWMGWRARGLMGSPGQTDAIVAIQRPEAVERLRAAVNDAPEELGSYGNGASPAPWDDACIRSEAVQHRLWA